MYLKEVRLEKLPEHHRLLPPNLERLGPYSEFIPGMEASLLFQFTDSVIRRRKYGPHDVPKQIEDQWMCVPLDIAEEYARLLAQKKVNVVAEVLQESEEAAKGMHETVLTCLIHTLAVTGLVPRGDTVNDIFVRYLQRLGRETVREMELAVPMVQMFLLHLPDTPDTSKKLEAISLLHDMAEKTPRSSAFFKTHRQACNQLPKLKHLPGFEELRGKLCDLDDPHMRRVLAAVDSPSKYGGGPLDRCLGEIRLFAGNKLPRGWMPCQGQELKIQENQALFSLIGCLYGGDGRTFFCLPDLRGRIPYFPPHSPAIPVQGGAAKVQLSERHLPVHAHEINVPDPMILSVRDPFAINVASVNGTDPNPGEGVGLLAVATATNPPPARTFHGYVATPSTPKMLGGIELSQSPHAISKLTITTSMATVVAELNLLPPCLALNYAIAVQGIYPGQ